MSESEFPFNANRNWMLGWKNVNSVFVRDRHVPGDEKHLIYICPALYRIGLSYIPSLDKLSSHDKLPSLLEACHHYSVMTSSFLEIINICHQEKLNVEMLNFT